jgi:cell division protein ZapA
MDEPLQHKVEVVVGGEVLTFIGTESEEYIQRLGRYIDKKIQTLLKAKKTASLQSLTKTMVIAVNIADDLFKETERAEAAQAELHRYMEELGKMQAENGLLQEKIHTLQMELMALRGELEEYMEAFSPPPDNLRSLHKIKR